MNNILITSPVTGKNNVNIVKKIPSFFVIDLYKRDFDIDVSKYFNGTQDFFICKCKDSLYRFYYPSTLYGDSHFYEELQNKTNFQYYHLNWEHLKAFEKINKNDSVLDIGCGSGLFLEKAMEKTEHVTGLEYNDLAIEKCKEKRINNVIKSNIEDFSKNNIEGFDIVCAFQVLEHISNVKSFIESCLKVLKPNGKLIIGVPNNNPYLYKYDIWHTLNLPPHHIGLWDKKSLLKLSEFFPMENSNLYIEPNFNYDYWLNIQIKHFFGINIIGKIVKKITYCILQKLNNQCIDGRNILMIYNKR
jgi:2-polyprenyl-3-methyl-5-hydroxy-6-metoxy-1,4-benzoquinol methylase